MVVLVTCKNEEDPLENVGVRVFKTLYINFSDAQGQITLELHVLVTCKNEDDRIKNERARVFTRFLPLQVYEDFSRRSRAANSAVLGRIWPKFNLVRDIMVVLVTCKYEEDPIKMKALGCSQHFPHYNPMGAMGCHGNKSSNLIWSKT